jgi:hypothetical protein
MDLTRGQMEDLERLIDRTGLCAVVRALVTICDYKADHNLQCWQGDGMAKERAREWTNNARRLAHAEDDMVY